MADLMLISLMTIAAVAAGLLSAVIFLSRKKKAATLWLGFLSLVSAVWVATALAQVCGVRGNLSELVARVYYLSTLLTPLSLVGLSLYYPYRRIKGLYEPIVFGLLAFSAALLAVTPGGMSLTYEGGERWFGVVEFSLPAYAVFLAVFLVAGVRSVGGLIKSYYRTRRQSEPILARQIQGVAITSGLAVTGIFLFSLVMPRFGDYTSIWIGPMMMVVVAFYIFVVLVKQGLLDLRMAVAKLLIYASLTAAILVVYIGALVSIDRFLFPETELHIGQQVFYLLCAALLALTVRPMHTHIDRLIHAMFYSRRRYTLSGAVEKISSIAASEIELSVMVRSSLEVISDALQPGYASLYVMSGSGKIYHYGVSRLTKNRQRLYQKQMDVLEAVVDDLPQVSRVNDISDLESSRIAKKVGASVIVKLSVHEEHVGVLFLGGRVNGSLYDDGDLDLIKLVGDELAVSIQNGLRFEEIQQFNKRLKTEVSRATRQLKRSNRQLQRLDEVKDEFLSIASHQLRTPLTSVNGYLSMILDGDAGDVTEQQRRLIEEAFVSSQHMVRLIEDFLNVSRIQTGRFAIEKRPTSLVDLVRREVGLLRMLSVGRGLEITLVEQGRIPDRVMVDEAKLRQVVMNFIDNAIYYSSPDSEIAVTLKESRGKVEFTVVDSGMGVPKADQEQLFTRFYRAPNARNRRPDGTGVGLYLAKKVVLAHGGEIIFKSREGRGSTFGFSVPLEKLKIPTDK